jgi:adenine-specific DNA-methyltransferase
VKPIKTKGVRYLGSKAKIVPLIVDVIENLDTKEKTLIDVFTGTTRVAQAFKGLGYEVITSDLSWASEAYSCAMVCNNGNIEHLQKYIDELNALDGSPGWLTDNYCDIVNEAGARIQVWKPHNGAKADAIREKIETYDIPHSDKMALVASLIFALDKVDNTVGLQQAYLKGWKSKRVNEEIKLCLLPVPEGPAGTHIVGDALKIDYPRAEIAYLDPPYTPADYSTYYHIWDSITRWDKPEVTLKTNRRIDRSKSNKEKRDKDMISPWYSKKTAYEATLQLVDRLPVKYVVFSYSDEGLITMDQMKEMGSKYKSFQIFKKEHTRHVMSRIGAGGAKAEKANKKKNVEHVIVIEKENEWPKALSHTGCGGYYNSNPCRAQTCNPEHDYCSEHQKQLDIAPII